MNVTGSPPSRALLRPRTYRLLITAVIVLTLARGLVWTVATPPWEAPDEPSHASYAEHLRENPDPFAGRVFFSTALYTSLQQTQFEEIAHVGHYPGVLAEGELSRRQAVVESIPLDKRAIPIDFEAAAGGYPPTYYLLGAGAIRITEAAGGSYLAQIQSLRLLSVLLTTIAIGLQIGLLHELLGRGMRAVAGAAIIALMPMYAHIFSSFNPDVLMAVWFSGSIWVALRIVRTGPSWRRCATLVGCVALALVTKPTALALLPLLVLVGVHSYVRSRGTTSRARRVMFALAAGVSAIGPLLLFHRFDDGVGTATELATTGSSSLSIAAIGGYVDAFRSMFISLYHTSFWGSFGWLDHSFRPAMYEGFLTLALLAAAGLLVRLIARRRVPFHWVIVLTPVASLVALLVAIEFTTYSSGSGLFIQGRYLFPVIAVLVAAYLSGITALTQQPWVGRALVTGSVVILIMYHWMALVGLVLPRYSL